MLAKKNKNTKDSRSTKDSTYSGKKDRKTKRDKIRDSDDEINQTLNESVEDETMQVTEFIDDDAEELAELEPVDERSETDSFNDKGKRSIKHKKVGREKMGKKAKKDSKDEEMESTKDKVKFAKAEKLRSKKPLEPAKPTKKGKGKIKSKSKEKQKVMDEDEDKGKSKGKGKGKKRGKGIPRPPRKPMIARKLPLSGTAHKLPIDELDDEAVDIDWTYDGPTEEEQEVQNFKIMQLEEKIQYIERERMNVANELHSLRPDLNQKTKLITELKNEYDRVRQDFDNYKKRMRNEIKEKQKIAAEKLITELLDVLDNFDRTNQIDLSTADIEDIMKGVQMIQSQMLDVLQKEGLKQIKAKGEPFDPNIHEAITTKETDDYPNNTVLDELQKGYKYKNKVIRATKVRVSQSDTRPGVPIKAKETGKEKKEKTKKEEKKKGKGKKKGKERKKDKDEIKKKDKFKAKDKEKKKSKDISELRDKREKIRERKEQREKKEFKSSEKEKRKSHKKEKFKDKKDKKAAKGAEHHSKLGDAERIEKLKRLQKKKFKKSKKPHKSDD